MQKKSLLNPNQQKAVELIYGPLLVLAGAGSGKTRVVTQRIAYLLSQGIEAKKILGLTFTNKAAGEMKERVQSLTSQDVLICTFHGLGARILRESIHLLGYERNFTIYDVQDAEKLIKFCLTALSLDKAIDVKNVLNYISQNKSALITPEVAVKSHTDLRCNDLPRIYEFYQAKLRECNAVDFDDLLYLTICLLREHPQLLEYYQNRWSFLLIDEYQDTNAAQYTIIHYLVEKHQNICVVGDPDQSIYSWRGANIKNILNFGKDYPGTETIYLDQSYRCRVNILEAANALISHNEARFEKHLWSDRGEGEKICCFRADTDRDEASFVARKILYHCRQHEIAFKQMAVFYRTNAQSRSLEDVFLLLNIPYVIVGGVSFYQRREIKDVLAFLRIVELDNDLVSFTRTINIPKRGIGEATLEKICNGATLAKRSLLDYCSYLLNEAVPPIRLSIKHKEGLKNYLQIIYDLRQLKASGSIQDLVTAAIEKTGYLNHLNEDKESAQERKENLDSLISKAAEWSMMAENPTLEGFLEELSLKSTLDEADSSKDKVSLMTIHNSKGLEFDVVFLVGMEENLFPHANSRESDQELEEERRLCYVGMTRAKDYLYMCHVSQRFLWGTVRSQRPSRFLYEIPKHLLQRN